MSLCVLSTLLFTFTLHKSASPSVITVLTGCRYLLTQVRVGSTLSELHEQERGVVHRGSITVKKNKFFALFSIKVNNIVQSVLIKTEVLTPPYLLTYAGDRFWSYLQLLLLFGDDLLGALNDGEDETEAEEGGEVFLDRDGTEIVQGAESRHGLQTDVGVTAQAWTVPLVDQGHGYQVLQVQTSALFFR